MGNWEKDQRLLWLVFFGISETMERYEILKEIGSGNFGVAKLARDKWTRELFAVKFIERGQKVCCFFFLDLFIIFSCLLLLFFQMRVLGSG